DGARPEPSAHAVVGRTVYAGRDRRHDQPDARCVLTDGDRLDHHRDQYDSGFEHVFAYDRGAVIVWAGRLHVHRGAHCGSADALPARLLWAGPVAAALLPWRLGLLFGRMIARLQGLTLAFATFA